MKTILDISNIVYGGYYGSQDFRISGFPMGGIRKVFGIINAELPVSDFVLCFDGGIQFRKELAPQYKAGRVPNYAVMAQIALLKEMLTDCNIPFLWKEDFEADDLICSCVRLFDVVKDPDSVVIYSDDRDLSCCVSQKVSIKNTTSVGTSVNRANFERRVVSGEDIPYNTILLHKMMHGDKSDNYQGVKVTGLRFADFALDFTRMLEPYIDDGRLPESSYMDIEVVNIVIDSLSGSVSDEAKELLKKQAKLVFPRFTDITYHGLDNFMEDMARTGEQPYRVEKRQAPVFGLGDFDQKKFNFYCSIMRLNQCKTNRYGSNFEENAEGFRAQLKLRAKELSSGAFAVEHCNHGRQRVPSVPVLENMQLPL